MFGLDDPQVWLAYLLCIVSALGAVIYGIVNWDKGDETIYAEDKKWVDGEKEASEEV